MRQYRSYSLLGDKIWPNHVRLQHLKMGSGSLVDVESEGTVIKPGKV